MFNQLQGNEGAQGYGALLDSELVNLVAAGNQEAFAEIVKRHLRSITSLAYRTLYSQADAEDVAQTVLIKLWQKPTSWDPNKASLSTWLYRVTLNACYDASRARSRRTELEQNDDSSISQSDVSEDISDRQESHIKNEAVQHAIKQLPDTQRDAITLAVFVGLPQKQVASILGVSVKAVESLLIRAKKSLKQSVTDTSGVKL